MKRTPLIERHVVVEETSDLRLHSLRNRLLLGENCQSAFLTLNAPLPPKFDTRMLILRKGRDLMVGTLLNTIQKQAAGTPLRYNGSVEILFDLRLDGFGFTQLVFAEGQEPVINEFSPYPEAKSTRSTPLKPRRWGFDLPTSLRPLGFTSFHAVFFAVFDAEEIFRYGPTVGFNFCRTDRNAGEFSSWSFMAGNGAPDANSLGRLHRKTPSARPRTAPVPPPTKNFRVSITNDSPMMVLKRHYTPASLDAEMRALKDWGVNRLHWIDYSNYPAFWAMPIWKKQYAATVKACGDLLAAACRAARKHKVELVPDFKLFDLSFTARGGTANQKDSLPGLDAPDLLCIPEMMGHEDAFLQTNPAWRRKPAFPIHTLRFFSREPLPAIKPGDLLISESPDNITYRKVRVNPAGVTVRKIGRPNRRWTPAGPEPEAGRHAAWMIEIRGLSIRHPFLAIEMSTVEGRLFNRHFALVEAIGKDQSEAPFLCSDALPHRGAAHKFDYFGNWPGWNNYNDHTVGITSLNLRSFGVALTEPPALTGLLEPTHPSTQKIWLDRIDYYLDHDVTGISIRTLCHHRRCPSWLQYAFAPSVLERFEKRHGRLPATTEADYAAIRRLRGEALGDFLAAAAARIRARKKKSIFQVETGGELPPDRESRMAMYFDYEKWISSGLFDELHVRSITGHSPWLRQTILPLARKHGVEVHLLTRNIATGFGPGDFLEIQKITRDAKALGYSGINFYEAANLYELTDADTFLPRAMGEHCVREAVRLSREA